MISSCRDSGIAAGPVYIEKESCMHCTMYILLLVGGWLGSAGKGGDACAPVFTFRSTLVIQLGDAFYHCDPSTLDWK